VYAARWTRRGRALLAGAVTLALTGSLSGVVVPAAVAAGGTELISPSTFGSGAAGWNNYGGAGTTFSTASGNLCGSIAASSGSGSAIYDAAMQAPTVQLTAGSLYTFSYQASATDGRSVHWVIQLPTAPYTPYAQGDDITPATTTTFTHTFTPTVSGAAVLAFQLGTTAAHPAAYTYCLTSASLQGPAATPPPPPPANANQVVNGTFDTDSTGWDKSGLTNTTVASGAFCGTVPGGTTNPWDVGFSQNTLHLVTGTNYDLEFDASGSTALKIRALAGQASSPYTTYQEWQPALTPAVTHFKFIFTSTVTDAAAQLAFQVGGKSATPWTFCLDNVVFKTTTESTAYVPDTGPRVRVNQVGYLPAGPKGATVVTTATKPIVWALMQDGAAVAAGVTSPKGTDPTSGLNVQAIDFSSYTTEGAGYTLVVDGATSYPFTISSAAYAKLRADSQNFFYTQRSGQAITDAVIGKDPISGNSYSRAAGHVSVAPNTGDVADPCQAVGTTAAVYTTQWTCPAGYTRDVTGGWYDAGDQGKYVVNGGIATYQLLSEFERNKTANSADTSALGDNTLAVPEHGNGVPDILDNARFELEWMLKMQVPAGTQMGIDGKTIDAGGLVHHKVQDASWTGLPLDPAADPKPRELHRPSTAATLNLAAVAAQGARLFAPYDKAFSAKLLSASKRAYAAAKAHPAIYAPGADGNSGGGAYDDTNVTDEFYWAAAELYLTTGTASYAKDVRASTWNTSAAAFDVNGFDWGHVAALGRLDLATVPNSLPGRAAIRASVVRAANAIVALQQAQPWGQPYAPADGKWAWGSTSQVLNNLVVTGTAYDLTNSAKYRNATLAGIDWILGRNAVDVSFVTDYGKVFSQNQHTRIYSNQLDGKLPHPPAGSLAGGPNNGLQDPVAVAKLTGCKGQFCYIDDINSYSTNEVAINWNSALSWVAGFVADQDNGGATPAAKASVHYRILKSKGTFRATITIRNTGKTKLVVHSLSWGYSQQQKVTSVVGAKFSQVGAFTTLSKIGHNSIKPGKTLTIVVRGNVGHLADTAPQQFWVNGKPTPWA
jgi:endoglucanase